MPSRGARGSRGGSLETRLHVAAAGGGAGRLPGAQLLVDVAGHLVLDDAALGDLAAPRLPHLVRVQRRGDDVLAGRLDRGAAVVVAVLVAGVGVDRVEVAIDVRREAGLAV